MAVLRPLKVVIENYPEGQSEELEAINNPEDPTAGTRRIRFGRELFVEREDFMENPPKKFFRLSPGKEVRLRYAYFVTCRDVVKNAAGDVIELRCTYDPETRGGNSPPDGRKVQATLHWVSAEDSVPAEIRLINPLFTRPDPNAGDFTADLNPNSLEVLTEARLEPAAASSNATEPVQFERQGYFCRDSVAAPGRPVFIRTVGLRDSYAKRIQAGLKYRTVSDVGLCYRAVYIRSRGSTSWITGKPTSSRSKRRPLPPPEGRTGGGVCRRE